MPSSSRSGKKIFHPGMTTKPKRSILLSPIRIAFVLTSFSLATFLLYTLAKNDAASLFDPQTHRQTNIAFDMEACLKDVLHHLPVGEGRWRLRTKGKTGVFAHHYDAHTGFWNQDIRFDPLPELQKDPCTVWEVGAHENAADSAELLKQYPKCTYHAYEPIPVFYNKLSKKWADEKHVVTHNYGLADKEGSFTVSEDALKGQSTYIAEERATSGKTMTAMIKSFKFALSEAGGQVPDLLHVNCEGCEWDMIPQAKKAGFLGKIPVINLGVHNYPNEKLGERSIQLCEMRSLLTETHEMLKGVPFGWERWVLRNRNESRLA